METATLAGGCFWCTEAIFKRLKGVTSVVSGYTGGNVENPSYEEVCGGDTGHAEAIQITFDPKVVPYEKLLEIFFALHDPTTLNRQGNDAGTQYRSVIFYTDDEQKKATQKFIDKLNETGPKVVTELKPFDKFYKAEDYHQKYYEKNAREPYCQIVINPKIEKL